jgi:hypothetical protein
LRPSWASWAPVSAGRRGTCRSIPTEGRSSDWILTLATDRGDLDVVVRPPGVDGYDALKSNALDAELADSLRVPVAELEDLIRMKRAAGRPKDRVELEILGALRDERDAEPDT